MKRILPLKIYYSIEEFKSVQNPVVTIGTFDGVHYGHQKIILRLKEISKDIGGEVVLLTFFPHPRMVLFPDDHGLQLLNTLDEKIKLLENLGVQHLIIHPFSKDFSRMNSTEFVRDMLANKIGTKKLVIGYDHHFGRNREGTFDDLLELSTLYNFEVEKIPEQDIDDVAVSSTKIRKALLEGDIATATNHLGYEYSLSGRVVEGKKIGRTLGYPTANINIKENYKLIPSNGIYAVRIEVNKNIYPGMLSIGHRPTFDNGERSIEVNIFDFDKEIYNEIITISFVSRIRDELKFNSPEALIKEIENDKMKALKILL